MARLHVWTRLLVATLVATGYAGALLAAPAAMRRPVASALLLLTTGAAFVVLAASLRVPTVLRRVRGLFALGLLGATVGGLLEFLATLHRHPLPVPSWADVAYLSYVPFVIAGVLAIPRRRDGSVLRLLLDGLVSGGALAFVSWSYVLAPVLRVATDSPVQRVVLLAYPVADVFVAAVALSTLLHVSRPLRSMLGLLAGGLLLIAVADSANAALGATGRPPHLWLFGVWEAGLILLLLGALAPARAPEAARQRDRMGTALTLGLPYLPLTGLIVVGLTRLAAGQPLAPLQMAFGTVALVGVVVRQVQFSWENARLVDVLGAREQRFSSLVAGSSDLTSTITADGVVTWQSPALTRLLGHPPGRFDGRPFSELVHPEDHDLWASALRTCRVGRDTPVRIRCQLTTADGGWRHTETVLHDQLDNPAVGSVVLNTRDVHDGAELETRLAYQASHDPLTGLANRTAYLQALTRARARPEVALGVLLVDLDGFKETNDSLGHAVGDRLLTEVGRRLQAATRDGELVARLGGDEFAVLIQAPPDEIDAATSAAARRVLDSLGRRARSGEVGPGVRCSIGSTTTLPGDPPETLLRQADLAMYAAKRAGGGQVVRFVPAMQAQADRRARLLAELPHALPRGQFTIVYQPMHRLPGGSLAGAEALLRWEHPELGEVTPHEFVPLADEAGLMADIGAWVVERGCRQMAHWRRQGRELPGLHLNVSSGQIQDGRLARTLRDSLGRHGIDASRITVEVTESQVADDEIGRELQRLREFGIHVALDDFGKGLSNLAQLASLPADTVKIDSTFVARLHDHAGMNLIRAVIALATTLGMLTVAEGVETVEQARALEETGCHFAQGSYFDRPLPPGEITPLLPASWGTSDRAG